MVEKFNKVEDSFDKLQKQEKKNRERKEIKKTLEKIGFPINLMKTKENQKLLLILKKIIEEVKEDLQDRNGTAWGELLKKNNIYLDDILNKEPTNLQVLRMINDHYFNEVIQKILQKIGDYEREIRGTEEKKKSYKKTIEQLDLSEKNIIKIFEQIEKKFKQNGNVIEALIFFQVFFYDDNKIKGFYSERIEEVLKIGVKLGNEDRYCDYYKTLSEKINANKIKLDYEMKKYTLEASEEEFIKMCEVWFFFKESALRREFELKFNESIENYIVIEEENIDRKKLIEFNIIEFYLGQVATLEDKSKLKWMDFSDKIKMLEKYLTHGSNKIDQKLDLSVEKLLRQITTPEDKSMLEKMAPIDKSEMLVNYLTHMSKETQQKLNKNAENVEEENQGLHKISEKKSKYQAFISSATSELESWEYLETLDIIKIKRMLDICNEFSKMDDNSELYKKIVKIEFVIKSGQLFEYNDKKKKHVIKKQKNNAIIREFYNLLKNENKKFIGEEEICSDEIVYILTCGILDKTTILLDELAFIFEMAKHYYKENKEQGYSDHVLRSCYFSLYANPKLIKGEEVEIFKHYIYNPNETDVPVLMRSTRYENNKFFTEKIRVIHTINELMEKNLYVDRRGEYELNKKMKILLYRNLGSGDYIFCPKLQIKHLANFLKITEEMAKKCTLR